MSREHDPVCESLADLCKAQKIKCLVQIGSEDGYESNFIREKIGCEVVAIEADTRCKPVDGINQHCVVIGAEDCMTKFYPHAEFGLSSKLPRNDHREGIEERQQQRLDTFCAMHRIKPDALIIDTEGTTLEVLRGCGDLLDSVNLVYAECQTSEFRPGVSMIKDVDEFLTKIGMKLVDGPPSYDAYLQGNYTWVRECAS